jgi:hypothetical protein
MYYYENIWLCISKCPEMLKHSYAFRQPETLFHFKTNGWIYWITAKVFTIDRQSTRK